LINSDIQAKWRWRTLPRRRASVDAEQADMLGKYWVNNITNEKGTYWNCNASLNHYKRRGIGMIDYRDTEKRQLQVNDVLPYLTVVDNDIRLQITEDVVALGYEGDVTVRTFGRGTVRKEKKINRGRPRQNAQEDQGMSARIPGQPLFYRCMPTQNRLFLASDF
jgi:hypothetical protein